MHQQRWSWLANAADDAGNSGKHRNRLAGQRTFSKHRLDWVEKIAHVDIEPRSHWVIRLSTAPFTICRFAGQDLVLDSFFPSDREHLGVRSVLTALPCYALNESMADKLLIARERRRSEG